MASSEETAATEERDKNGFRILA